MTIRSMLACMVAVLLPGVILPAASLAGNATGGNATNIVDLDYVHLFTTAGEHTFTVIKGGAFKVLVVAGGGGGGLNGGGGGAGGFVYEQSVNLEPGPYPVFVGAGGAGGITNTGMGTGTNGQNSFFYTSAVSRIEAIGGGGGGRVGQNGMDGGSGGGAGRGTVTLTGGLGTGGQGKNGGNNRPTDGSVYPHGGGGGALTAGATPTTDVGGNGGTGTNISITGATVTYAGGGGGGTRTTANGGAGGAGGGGRGGGAWGNPGGGTNNLGGGGGGGRQNHLADYTSEPGAAGGSGVVIVRYLYELAEAELTVTANAASALGANTATLNGLVNNDGTDDNSNPPDVYFCWGTEEPEGGGTVGTGTWHAVVDMGPKAALVPFSHTLNDLAPNQSYVYRVFATNNTGAWSDPMPFTTYGPPTVIRDSVIEIARFGATLQGIVTATGGQNPGAAGFEWWPVGGSSTSSVNVGAQTGAFHSRIGDLEASQSYQFRAWASNSVGGVGFSDIGSFETLGGGVRTLTWIGGTGGWNGFGNWRDESMTLEMPALGDTVIVTNGSVLLSNATANLAAFTITNATLTFTNWNAKLSATTVAIRNGGILTLPAAFADAGPSNRVWLGCTDLTVDKGGSINATGKGFSGGNGPSTAYGYRYHGCAGAGHGGRGGAGAGMYVPNSFLNSVTDPIGDGDGSGSGVAYGSTNAPLAPGSGGGNYTAGLGGNGGGAVLIEAIGNVIINGTVTANGGNAAASTPDCKAGGGSGGSIYIDCAAFGGDTNGLLQANGGNGTYVDANTSGGGGSGGRIAINYASLISTPGVRFSANAGTGWKSLDNNALRNSSAKLGTVWFPDGALMNSVLATWNGLGARLNGFNGFLHIGAGATYTWTAGDALSLTNSTLGIPASCIWNIPGNLSMATGGVVVAAGAKLNCQGSLDMQPYARLVAYGGATNGLEDLYGTFIGISNDLSVASNAWIYPFSHGTDGGAVLFKSGGNVTISGGIDANGRGYGLNYGNGRGGDQTYSAGGGGHGGKGGRGVHANGHGAAGVAYGSSNAPVTAGSGGGNQTTVSTIRKGNHGGGVVWMQADGNIVVNGIIRANGNSTVRGTTTSGGGAGAGGSIFLDCGGTFGGGGDLQAKGGNCYPGATNGGGGGGGGRIAVWQGMNAESRAKAWANNLGGRLVVAGDFTDTAYEGTHAVTQGTSLDAYPDANSAFPGSVVVISLSRSSGTVFMFR